MIDSCVRSSGLAHFAHLKWPTWSIDILPHPAGMVLAALAGVEPGGARRAVPF